jgi:myo-inositol-1(or 4)-monophosphatase
MEKDYQKIIEAAQAGGQVLKNYFGQNLDIEEKSMPADIRTKADTESEEAILKILKNNFPDYNINSEETDYIENNSEYTFIVDPLDGSNNFVMGVPNFSVIIALQKNNETIFGVIYHPILEQTYYAAKNGGAFLNGKSISVNQNKNIEDVALGLVWGYLFDQKDKEINANYTKRGIESKLRRVCLNWSVGIDFCLLASGKMEAIFDNGCDPHDYVAGKLILQEAGGMITDFDGNLETDPNSDKFLATNNKIINSKLLKILI